MIAVMGGSGHVGGRVASILLAGGEKVRLLRHRREVDRLADGGADVVTGDAGSYDDMMRWLDGSEAALVLLPEDLSDPNFESTRSAIARNIAKSLSDSGVGHVVAVSAVQGDPRARGPMRGLGEFEQQLSDLQAHLLVLRPAFYQDYLLMGLPLIRARRINGSALRADLPIPMVAIGDVARVAAEALSGRGFEGHTVRELLGPEEVTMREATRQIGARLGIPDLPYIEFPPDEVASALQSAGAAKEVADLIVAMQLSMNEGLVFADVRRTRDNTMPTRIGETLDEALGLPVAEEV